MQQRVLSSASNPAVFVPSSKNPSRWKVHATETTNRVASAQYANWVSLDVLVVRGETEWSFEIESEWIGLV